MTVVSAETSGVVVIRGASAVSRSRSTIASAFASERALIVSSTVLRSNAGRSSSRMPVSSYGVDSEIGPMPCWMPRNTTTVSSSAPT